MNYLAIPGLRYRPRDRPREGIDKVIQVVCTYFDIKEKYLTGKSRRRTVVYPRFIAMYILRNYYSISLLNIAQVFKRDHTTVINATKVCKNLMTTDDDFKDDFKQVHSLIFNS